MYYYYLECSATRLLGLGFPFWPFLVLKSMPSTQHMKSPTFPRWPSLVGKSIPSTQHMKAVFLSSTNSFVILISSNVFSYRLLSASWCFGSSMVAISFFFVLMLAILNLWTASLGAGRTLNILTRLFESRWYFPRPRFSLEWKLSQHHWTIRQGSMDHLTHHNNQSKPIHGPNRYYRSLLLRHSSPMWLVGALEGKIAVKGEPAMMETLGYLPEPNGPSKHPQQSISTSQWPQ